MKWIVEIHDGCWLAPWDGDPGRTLVKENAKQFTSQSTAMKSLETAESKYSHRNYSDAKIFELPKDGEG